MRTRALSALATLALAATTVTTVAVPATAAAAEGPGTPRCQGRAATIVGSGRVEGTSRDDVIVVTGRGSAFVEAGGGDDRICLRHRGYVLVQAGDGDDRIVNLKRRGRPDVTLGPGDDTYVGSSGPESVVDLDFGRGSAPSGGVDTIRTGGGDDFVAVGDHRQASRDTVDLGEGDDSLLVFGGPGQRGGTLSGGGGEDSLSVQAVTGSALVVDAVAQSATVGGQPFAQWSSFDTYDLHSLGPLSFQGTPGDDILTLATHGPATVSTGAGDDSVSVWPLVADASGTIAAGDGQDSVVLSSRSDVVGTVGTGTGTLRAGGGTLTTSSVEKHTASSRGDVELTGSDGDDELWADGCHVTLRGGAGDDRLHSGSDTIDAITLFDGPMSGKRCTDPTSTVLGEAGDDVLVLHDSISFGFGRRPARRDTLLDGGEGRDVAIGGGSGPSGRDRTTCMAETQVSCEE